MQNKEVYLNKQIIRFMSNLKVASSTFNNENRLDYNSWMETYKVGSRVKDKYVPSQRVEYIMQQYDNQLLHKMIKGETKRNLIKSIIKILSL
jgi:hypothetical protein